MENGFLTRNQGLDMIEKITGFVKSRTYDRNAIDNLLVDKQDVLNFDNTPTENSTNPVTSGGVYDAISNPDLYEVNIFYDFTLDELKIPTEYTQVGYAVYKNGEDITNTITNFKTFVDNLNNTNNILKFYSVKSSSVDTPNNHRELLRNYMSSTNFVTMFNVYNSDVVGTIRFKTDEITCTFKESTIDVVDRIVEDTYGCNVHIVLDVTDVPVTDIDLNNLMFANVEDYVQTIKYAKYKVNKTAYSYDTEVTYTDSIVKFINNVLPSLNAHYNLSITVDIIKSTGESSWEERNFYAEYINHGINEPYDNYLKLSHDFSTSGASDIYDYPQNSMQYAGLIVVPGVEYPEGTSYCKIARVVDTELTENSNNYITSGTMFDIIGNYYTKSETNNLLNDKQDALTFDTVPTDKSENPVTSDGIYNDIHMSIAEDSTYESVKTLSNCGAFPMLSLKVGIEPIQEGSGDPSPENVRHISGHTEANVTKCGKNLFSYNNGFYNIYYTSNTPTGDGSFVTLQNAGGWKSVKIKVKGLSKITISGFMNQGGVYSAWLGSDDFNDVISTFRSIDNNGTKQVPSGAEYVVLGVYNIHTEYETYPNAQIEVDDTATTYEPYNGQTYNIQFKDGDNPLTVYGGSLDVVSGVLTVDRAYYNISDITFSESGNYYRLLDNSIPFAKSQFSEDGILSHFNYGDRRECIVGTTPSSGHYIMFYKNKVDALLSISSVADFNAYLVSQKTNGNPVQLVYKLATPQTYQLTPTAVKSLLGTNNIWADTGDVGDVRYFVKNAASDIITAVKDICYTKSEIDAMIGDISSTLDTINGEVV